MCGMATSLFACRRRAALGLSAVLLVACGGRTEYAGDEMIDPSSTTGGASSAVPTTSAPYSGQGGASYLIPATSSPWVMGSGGATRGIGGTKAYATGGSPYWATGGKAYSVGGAIAATGGKAYSVGGAIAATGGKAYSVGGAVAATGGKAYSVGGAIAATGGKAYASGGATIPATTATGGKAYATGGSSAISCAGVSCAAIPTTCTLILQPVGACCPVCMDTGCPPCATIVCAAGQHVETVAGDCCPSCVADPPDPCVTGQKNYASIRQSMIDKYSYLGCSNSTECVIVPESNACASTCGIPMVNNMVESFKKNLEQSAQDYCSTCKPVAAGVCPAQVPACVNGKCVAVSPS
jgi:hypothetical protein